MRLFTSPICLVAAAGIAITIWFAGCPDPRRAASRDKTEAQKVHQRAVDQGRAVLGPSIEDVAKSFGSELSDVED